MCNSTNLQKIIKLISLNIKNFKLKIKTNYSHFLRWGHVVPRLKERGR